MNIIILYYGYGLDIYNGDEWNDKGREKRRND